MVFPGANCQLWGTDCLTSPGGESCFVLENKTSCLLVCIRGGGKMSTKRQNLAAQLDRPSPGLRSLSQPRRQHQRSSRPGSAVPRAPQQCASPPRPQIRRPPPKPAALPLLQLPRPHPPVNDSRSRRSSTVQRNRGARAVATPVPVVTTPFPKHLLSM